MLELRSLSTYNRFPLTAREIGRIPPEASVSTRLSPLPVTRNDVIVLSPSLTTNSTFPASAIELEESTIENVNGGCAARPGLPVCTVCVKLRLPSEARL